MNETSPTGVESAELIEASDPGTPSARLHRLLRWRDREVRRAVAGNPNTPIGDLDTLARRFPSEFAGNPLIDWLTLTDADWPKEFSELSRHRVLASTISVPLLWWAVNNGDEADQIATASNPSCPLNVLRSLVATGQESVSEVAELHAAFDPVSIVDHSILRASASTIASDGELADLLAAGLLPQWLVAELDVPSEPDARRELARHQWASADTLRDLLGDEDEETRRLARTNASTRPVDIDRWNRLRLNDPSLDAADLDLVAATPHGRERCAHHPRLGEQTRRGCVTDASWRVREAAARNRLLSTDEAAGLAMDGDRDVRAAVAGNPALPTAAVFGLQLDADERVRSAVQARLGATEVRRGPKYVVMPDPASRDPASRNPSSREPFADLLDIERSPTPLTSLLRRGAARSSDLAGFSASEIEIVVADDDVLVRAALALNATAPAELLVRLSADPDPLVRRRVAARVADGEMIERLASDTHAEVQAGVASNPGLPSWLARRLAASTSDDVRVALATRADVNPEVLALLFGRAIDDAAAIEAGRLVRSGITDPVTNAAEPGAVKMWRAAEVEDLCALFEQHTWAALLALGSSTFPPELLATLRSSPNWRVRQAVAGHQNTGTEDLAVLAIDSDNDVRAAVARNSAVALDEFPSFVVETDEKVRRALVERPDIGVGLLCVHLLGDDGIRKAAIEHPRLPPEIRDELEALLHGAPLAESVLLRFVNTSARSLVVAHPSTTSNLLRDVVDDPAWTIREAVAHHPNCSPDSLRRLAEDQDRDVRAAAGANSRTPIEVLSVLVGDDDPRVRRAVIANPTWVDVDTSERASSLARSLLRNESSIVRVVGLFSHDIPPSFLARPRHLRSIDWLERFAVAVHPNTPTAARRALANDANIMVRAGATGEVSWPHP